MAISLLELRTQSRERADMENSQFIKDSELNSYINNSIAELHDIMIQAYGSDYFLAPEYEFTTTSGVSKYNLPSDFYKLRGVDLRINSNEWTTVDKFNFNERNRSDSFSLWSTLGFSNVRYRVMGSSVIFSPLPDASTSVRMWYIPTSTKLEEDADELIDYNAWSEYVIVDAAIKMLQKEETDVQVLMLQKQALKRRIEEVANNRDAAKPESVTDIYAENVDDIIWRGRS